MSKELWKINESLKDVVARLVGVKREIKQSDELTREVLANVAQSTKNLKKKNRDKEIIGAIKDIPKTEFPKVQEVKIKNPVKKIEVEKPSWYKGFKLDKGIFDPLLEAIGGLVNRVFSVRVENLPKNPKGFLPVRLTDGKFWLGLPSGGGGGPKVVGVKDGSDNRINPATSNNQTNGTQQAKVKETVPTDSTKVNSSCLISFNAGGDAVYADEIISGTTYRTTFTRDDMVIDSTLPISGAVEL